MSIFGSLIRFINYSQSTINLAEVNVEIQEVDLSLIPIVKP